MSNFKINQSIVDELIRLLLAPGFATWELVESELQDNAEFVLLSVKLAHEPDERRAEGREHARNVLAAAIPPKTDGSYSWMVVFKHSGEIVDSVFDGAV